MGLSPKDTTPQPSDSCQAWHTGQFLGGHNIALRLGEKHHPEIRCRIEQVKSWFDLIASPQVDLSKTAKAFFAIKTQVLGAWGNVTNLIASKWPRTKGPIGALISTLTDIGWNPVSLYKWIGGAYPGTSAGKPTQPSQLKSYRLTLATICGRRQPSSTMVKASKGV